jgi:hypothetical protein
MSSYGKEVWEPPVANSRRANSFLGKEPVKIPRVSRAACENPVGITPRERVDPFRQ